MHNLLHDTAGRASIQVTDEERRVYERVSHEAAARLAPRLCSGDVVILHDPQTLGLAPWIRQLTEDVILVYRSHIGVDKITPATKTAWAFLKPFAKVLPYLFVGPERKRN